MTVSDKNAFLMKHGEKELLNQYWYSSHTIEHLVQELQASATSAAFLSTPSVYFSLPKGSALRKASWVFDLDDQWASDPHFFKYDFRDPGGIPEHLHHAFDCVVIDPPVHHTGGVGAVCHCSKAAAGGGRESTL
ncbi:MAG: hypothetical protein WDW38_008261 [Sanguina aurantia]